MSAQIGVYNPDDEELEFQFDGRVYQLAPETVTMVPRPALGVILSQLGEYGVSPIPVDTTKAELNRLVASAKERWLAGTRKWAEDILLASAKANKERTEIGISPIEGPQVEQARSWLKKHGFLAALLLSLLLPSASWAQWANIDQKVAHSIYTKDVTGASYTYCKLLGRNGDPFNAGIEGPGTIKTTGSSTTVDEAVASTNPFSEVAVGDMLVIQVGSTVYRRAVTAKASAAQITVDTAITLSGNAWTWYRQSCGTGAEDGWFDASNAYQINWLFNVTTINATSIDASIECRLGGMPAATVGTRTITATGVFSDIILAGVWDECRVGLKLTADTGAQNVTLLYGLQEMN